MSNNIAKVSATDDGIPVSDTLALLLQALNTGASITINLPPGTFPPGGLAAGNSNVQPSVPGNSSVNTLGSAPGPNVTSGGVATVSSGVTTAPAPTGGNVVPGAVSSVSAGATPAPVLPATAPTVPAGAVPVPVPVSNVASTPSTTSTGGNTLPAPGGTTTTPTVPAVAPPAPGGLANPIPAGPEPLEPMDPAAIAIGAQGNDLEEDIHVRFYCVTVGRRIGIFAGWGNTAPHVNGASGSCYTAIDKGRGARNRAMRAFNAAFAAGNFNVVP